jgi:hypothetical protein
MSVIDRLAASLGINSDEPNQKLAEEIIATKDRSAVEELVQHLSDKNPRIQSNCIKVLYEIGERGAPELIAPFWETFLSLLTSKNNRFVWGAMTALDMIALLKPKELNAHIQFIRNTMTHGSVITIDHAVSVFAKLASVPEFEEPSLHFLWDLLRTCDPGHFPQYFEKSVIAINKHNKQLFTDLADMWLTVLEKDSQRKRVQNVLKKIR